MNIVERHTYELDRVKMLIPTFLSETGSASSTDVDPKRLITRFVDECTKVWTTMKETLREAIGQMYSKQANLLIESARASDSDAETAPGSGGWAQLCRRAAQMGRKDCRPIGCPGCPRHP